MATQTLEISSVYEKGMALYHETIRPQLTEADKGKYLFIHTGAGKWIMGADESETGQRAIDLWGHGQPVLVHRAGYRAATSFRIGADLELKEW